MSSRRYDVAPFTEDGSRLSAEVDPSPLGRLRGLSLYGKDYCTVYTTGLEKALLG